RRQAYYALGRAANEAMSPASMLMRTDENKVAGRGFRGIDEDIPWVADRRHDAPFSGRFLVSCSDLPQPTGGFFNVDNLVFDPGRRMGGSGAWAWRFSRVHQRDAGA